jgi:CheY-like chemotaxis protein
VKVLVVDDNADAADSLGLLLGQLGHETRVVYDGESALVELMVGWPHVALLDIGMPDMSGYEVVDRLRASRPSQLPVLVALTGWGQDEDRQRSKEAGFARHLTKPIDFDVLCEVLESVQPVPGA